MRKSTRQQNIDTLRGLRDADNDWVFQQFDKDFKKGAKRTVAGFLAVWLGILILNLAVWGGLIYFVVWLLNHYGVI